MTRCLVSHSRDTRHEDASCPPCEAGDKNTPLAKFTQRVAEMMNGELKSNECKRKKPKSEREVIIFISPIAMGEEMPLVLHARQETRSLQISTRREGSLRRSLKPSLRAIRPRPTEGSGVF